MMKYITSCITFLLLFTMAGVFPAAAQQDDPATEKEYKRAWEFGLGGSVFQFNRVSFSNFKTLSDGGYKFDLDLKHAVYGGNIYIAREITPHFYIDLQGFAGFTKQKLSGENKNKWLFAGGLGLQWRLGEYFGPGYIDPYLRVGAGYMHKQFNILYTGKEGVTPDQMDWVLQNISNKDGVDKKHLIPISMGVGVNMWFNDRWGIGIQGDYVLMPYSNVANSLEGSVRIMYRLGGKSKKAVRKVIHHIPQQVEVEKIVEVEKLVEVEIPCKEDVLCELFNNIYFDFDMATLTHESQEVLDRIAKIMKDNSSDRYLITGYTDARGSQAYNQGLSERRALAVVEALEERGISRDVMKYRGVGERTAMIEESASDNVRRGDRKVTIEFITNDEFWDHLRN